MMNQNQDMQISLLDYLLNITSKQVMKVGDPLGGLVVPHSASKPYVINDPRYAKLSHRKI